MKDNAKALELVVAAMRVANSSSDDVYEAQRILEDAIANASPEWEMQEWEPDRMMAIATMRRAHDVLVAVKPLWSDGSWSKYLGQDVTAKFGDISAPPALDVPKYMMERLWGALQALKDGIIYDGGTDLSKSRVEKAIQRVEHVLGVDAVTNLRTRDPRSEGIEDAL